MPPSDQPHDLLRRYAATRDAAAFSDLLVLYQDFVYGICRRVLGNASDAEDAAQECFLDLAEQAGSIGPGIGGWLHRCATRRALDFKSAAVRRRHREQAYGEAQAGAAAATPQITWKELSPCVDRALDDLPDDLRYLLVEHFLRRRSQADLAAELGVSGPTMSRRIESGVTALRARLSALGLPVALGLLLPLLASTPACAAPAALSASLGKMALAGLGPTAGATVGTTAGAGAAAVGTASALSLSGVLAGGLAACLASTLAWTALAARAPDAAPPVPVEAPMDAPPAAEADAPALVAPVAPAPRTLMFPADRTVGELFVRPLGAARVSRPGRHPFATWEPLGEARGIVAIAPGLEVALATPERRPASLSPWRDLAPTDLAGLAVHGPDDDLVARLARLHGLRELWLSGGDLGGGFATLARLPRLERLTLWGCRGPGPTVLPAGGTLRELCIGRCTLPEGGLNGLATGALTDLTLLRTPLSESDLALLCTLRSLATLRIADCGLPADARARLEAALPGCVITMGGYGDRGSRPRGSRDRDRDRERDQPDQPPPVSDPSFGAQEF